MLPAPCGTSDKLEPSFETPGLEGHFFPNPVEPHSHMVMLCYKNGSLSREAVAKRCCDGNWDTFASQLQVRACVRVRLYVWQAVWRPTAGSTVEEGPGAAASRGPVPGHG